MSPRRADNKLWERHRLILPEMREKIEYTCKDCYFFTEIVGEVETRWGCVVDVPLYRTLARRVPSKISARQLIGVVGKEKLLEMVTQSKVDTPACGWFKKALGKKHAIMEEKMR